jgi:RHS repeat-associated protein
VFALIEKRTGENEVIRYQYDNHLGSACLELDANANIISYEEYHPFGTTSYRAGRSYSETSLKRYKYCGKERDEETGLYYYGARYYASWLCRWVSTEPLQSEYLNLSPYCYCANNPIVLVDPDGKMPIIIIDEQSKTIIIYQPVFVITEGEGALSVEEIPKLQKEFDDNISTSNFPVIRESNDQTYNISIVFQFFEGGTFNNAEKKNKDAMKTLEAQVYGTFSSFSNDTDFENKYTRLKGEGTGNPKTVGGFINKKMDIYIRGSKATWREKIHEGFHLLNADDADDAVGIMKYTDGYGKGPGVNAENVQEVLNKSIKENPGGVFIFNVYGDLKHEYFLPETFKVQEKTITPTNP